MTTIRIAAVGDILMWNRQIQSAKVIGKNVYEFNSMFSDVRTYLSSSNLAIGNLETTLSGREDKYQRTNPKTHFPMFNCPDELACTLKWAGFHVLTTANNHCMDRGEAGLTRTIHVLSKHGLYHTGTFSSQAEARKYLVLNVQGIRVGILSYTYGTNAIPVPVDKAWMVNRIRINKIAQDVEHIRSSADIVIVAMHFGKEFYRFPNDTQKQLTDKLFFNGADVVLGAHPHVLQPMQRRMVKDKYGVTKRRVVAYSLGNFISDRMMNNPLTQLAGILGLDINKDSTKYAEVIDAKFIPTWTLRSSVNGHIHFRVVPVRRLLDSPKTPWSTTERNLIERALRSTIKTSW